MRQTRLAEKALIVEKRMDVQGPASRCGRLQGADKTDARKLVEADPRETCLSPSFHTTAVAFRSEKTILRS
jgi:hypothetical protein